MHTFLSNACVQHLRREWTTGACTRPFARDGGEDCDVMPSPATSRPALATSARNGCMLHASFLGWRRNAAAERRRSRRRDRLWDGGGGWARALGRWAEMAESAAQQDTIAYDPAPSSCEKDGEWRLALGIWAEIEEDRKRIGTPSSPTLRSAMARRQVNGNLG